MLHLLAIAVVSLGVVGLFLLDRDPKFRTSRAFWLPLVWLLIASSRSVGEWMQLGAPSEANDAYMEGNPFDRNVLGILIALGVIVLISRRQRLGAILRVNAPILLFIAYCGLSLLWSDYPLVGFKRWIRIMGDIVMVLVVLTERDWLGARKRLYAWLSFVLLPASVLLIRYYPDLGRSYNVHDGTLSWTGVTTTKNSLGMICMVFGLAAAARVIDAYRGGGGPRRTRLLVAHGAVALLALWLIQMANSATAVACTALGGVVLILTNWRALLRRPALVHGLVAGLLLVAFSAVFLSIGSGMVQGLGRDATLTGRTDVWNRALKLVTNPVLGSGFESFWLGPRLDHMRRLDPGLNQAHNGYIEIYLNLGWVGIIMLAIVILTGYRNIMAVFRRYPALARLSLMYFVVTLDYNISEGAFKMGSLIWLSFLMAIIAVPSLSSPEVQAPAPVSNLTRHLADGWREEPLSKKAFDR